MPQPLDDVLAQANRHYMAGNRQQAEGLYQQALRQEPDNPDALHMLGVLARDAGNRHLAIDLISRALARKPDAAPFHNNLGLALQGAGLLYAASEHFQEALRLQPGDILARANLGNVFRDQGKWKEAVACYREVLRQKPDFAEVHYNLGNAFKDQKQLTAAAECFQEAARLKPSLVEVHNNLANVLKDQGRVDEAVEQYRRAAAAPSADVYKHSNLLLTMHYSPAHDARALAAEHRRWNERYGRPLAAQITPHVNAPDPDRRLRVGYVSTDLGNHPVGFFLEGVLAAHDHSRVEVICYAGISRPDDVTARLRGHADGWRSTLGMTDQALAEQIRSDRIDLLVDLGGHTARHRLLVFARKPAPVQVTWMGYVNTTGLDTMDYLIADRYHAPPGVEEFFREELVRLPDGYICYRPPDYAPPVVAPPARRRGFVTFGCFNNLAKVTPAVVQLWARVLRGLPSARLVLRTPPLADAPTAQRYRGLFAAQGIGAERLDLLGGVPHQELLSHYNQIDMALDPFPYSGGLTTCEALWMGVPVVTWTGQTFPGRHSTSHLSNVGLTELVTTSPEQYVETALQLANDSERLARLRVGLRGRMAASPLCDGPRFTRHLEEAYRRMWQRWCQGTGPGRRR